MLNLSKSLKCSQDEYVNMCKNVLCNSAKIQSCSSIHLLLNSSQNITDNECSVWVKVQLQTPYLLSF